MKNIYHQIITVIFYQWGEVFSSPGIIELFGILTYIRICFSGHFSEGSVLIKFCLCLRKKVTRKGTDSMSHTPEFILWCEFVGHSIVLQSMCFIYFESSNQLLLCTCTIPFMGGVSHVYFHIIFITFNSCFCHCSYFWRGTRLDREILNSIKKSVSKGTTPDRNPNSIKKRFCPPLCNSFRHCCFFCDWTDWTARSIWGWSTPLPICIRHWDRYTPLCVLWILIGFW